MRGRDEPRNSSPDLASNANLRAIRPGADAGRTWDLLASRKRSSLMAGRWSICTMASEGSSASVTLCCACAATGAFLPGLGRR